MKYPCPQAIRGRVTSAVEGSHPKITSRQYACRKSLSTTMAAGGEVFRGINLYAILREYSEKSYGSFRFLITFLLVFNFNPIKNIAFVISSLQVYVNPEPC